MVTIANLTADALGNKNIVLDADGLENVTANYAPAFYSEYPTVVRESEDTWIFSWDATTGVYSLYRDGESVANAISDTSYTIISDTEPSLEVYPSNVEDEPYTAINKPFADLYWFSDENQIFRVQQWDGAEWDKKGRPIVDVTTGYKRFNTEYIGDDSEELWRVTPYNIHDVAGTPVEKAFNVVSHPTAPSYTASVVAGSLVIEGA